MRKKNQGKAEVPVLEKECPSLSVQKTQDHQNAYLGPTARHCSVPILVSHTKYSSLLGQPT